MNIFGKAFKKDDKGTGTDTGKSRPGARNSKQYQSQEKSAKEKDPTGDGPESGSFAIWKHAVEQIPTGQLPPAQSAELMTEPLSDHELTFQMSWLQKLWTIASKVKATTPAETPHELEEDISRSTRRLVVRISYFMEKVIDQFVSVNTYNPLNINITTPQEVREPKYDEPLEYGKEHKLVESYFRFRVSSSSWSISIRANAGAIEFFILPNTDLIRLSLHERSERLKLRLVLDQQESRNFFDLWSLDGLPVDEMELKSLMRNLFKELILRSCGQMDIDVGLLLPDLQGERLTKALRDLVLEKQGLAQKIVMQQEEIQNRLARDLHDTVISDVMMLKRSLSGDRRLSDQESIVVLDNIIARLREVCYDLAPRDLKDWGLGTVIEDLLHTVAERTGAEFVLDCENEVPELPGEVQLHVFRIFQEALNNIEKYAGASNIYVSIKRDDEKLTFVICDDGKGFELSNQEPKSSREGGFGMGGIRERADLIRCFYPTQLFVESEPGKGSKVTLEITFPKDTSLRERI